MEFIRSRPLSEEDIDGVIKVAGGRRAHPDADRRDKPSADYIFFEALIELKFFDDEGLLKSERQKRLAQLFKQYDKDRPVVVLDRQKLPEAGRRSYNRILESPIKSAISSARGQLKQSQLENPSIGSSILFVFNNGYTALNHNELLDIVVHRVRNDTREIDGVVVAGCYYYSDGIDSNFIWPMEYVPINLERPFTSYQKLLDAWHVFQNDFMTSVVLDKNSLTSLKFPIADLLFEIDGVVYIKPAPPMGEASQFFGSVRPRKNSTGLTSCPPVAINFADLSRTQWKLLRGALGEIASSLISYENWLAERAAAAAEGRMLQPFVPIAVNINEWKFWCIENGIVENINSVHEYASYLFEKKLKSVMGSVRELSSFSVILSSYIFVITEEIGQDKANDVSHIALIKETPNSKPEVFPLVTNARIFHEYAITVASAYAVAFGISSVIWDKDKKYSWI